MTMLVQLGIFLLMISTLTLSSWLSLKMQGEGENVLDSIVVIFVACVLAGCLLVLWSFAGGLAADLTQ